MNAHLDQLGGLDPDSSRPASHQIANLLRAAIRTAKLRPGEQLPSQPDLARHYGVHRETIKAALRVLAVERLIVSRQGSGTYVRADARPGDAKDAIDPLRAEVDELRKELRELRSRIDALEQAVSKIR